MTIAYFLFLFYFFCLPSCLWSQLAPAGISLPPAPEAAGAGRYGDIPVGEHSGAANVNIPIYTIQTRGGSIPVSLNYHTGGVRVGQEAEWTGLGWSLQAGGSISRTVRGRDDFGGTFTSAVNCTDISYTGYYTRGVNNQNYPNAPKGALLNGEQFNEGFLRILPINNDIAKAQFENGLFDREQLCPDETDVVDSESDLYSINLPGLSAKFFLDDAATPRLIEAGNIEIVISSNPTADNVAWTVIGPDGTEYKFGTTRQSRQMLYSYTRTRENGQEQTPTCSGGVLKYNSYISAWYLDEIRYPSGEKITISYDFELAGIEPVPSFADSREDKALVIPPPPGYTWTGENTEKETQYILFEKHDRVYPASLSVFLKNTATAIETIVFETSGRTDLKGGKKLDKIKIYKGGQLFKWFQLKYDYFQSNLFFYPNRWEKTTNNPTLSIGSDDYLIQTFANNNEISDFILTATLNTQRLKLISIQDMGDSESAQTSQIPPYQFGYNTTALPPKTAFAVDHWGFSNGKASNNKMYPRFSGVLNDFPWDATPITLDLPGADREPDEDYARACNLELVTYPPGGATQFEYELNRSVDDQIVARFRKESLDFEYQEVDCATRPPQTPGEYFAFDDMHADVTTISVKMDWTIHANCDNTCLDNQDGCLRIGQPGDPQYDPELGFKYVVERQNGVVLFEQVWYAHDAPVQIRYQNHLAMGRIRATLPRSAIQENEQYRMKLVSYGIAGNQLPWNVIEIRFSLEWRTLQDDTIKIGPGLRIRQVIDKDENGAVALSRRFKYVNDDGSNSGRVINNPSYHSYAIYYFSENSPPADPWGMGGITAAVNLVRNSNSVFGLSSSYLGTMVSYDRVVTQIEGKGSTVKIFYNEIPEDDVPFNLRVFNLPRFVNQKVGQLLEHTDYDEHGAMKRKIVNTYISYIENLSVATTHWNHRIHVTGSNVVSGLPSLPNCGVIFVVISYADVPQWHYLAQSAEILYSAEGEAKKITRFAYEPTLFNLTSNSLVNSDGEIFKTQYEYAGDLGFTCMVTKHMTGIPLRVTAPDGVKTTTEYDCNHFVPSLIRETFTDGSSIIKSQVQQFNAQGYPLNLTVFGYPAGETYTWNNGLLESKTYLAWTQRFEYFTTRMLKSAEGIDGQKIEYAYDTYQRLNSVKSRPTQPGAATHHIHTEIIYQLGGPNVVTTQTTYSDAPTQTLSKYFDGLGRPILETHNGVEKKRIVYDQSDRIFRQTYLPGNFVHYEYDNSPLNRIILEVLPDGHYRKHRFTTMNNMPGAEVIDEKGNASKVFDDFLDRRSLIVDALGGQTKFTYFKHGGPKTVTPPSGGPYLYDYDNRRRLTYKKVPGARAQIFRYYDENNLLKYSIDGKGQRIDHYYDDYLRLRRSTLAQVPNWDPEAPNPPHGAPGSDILLTRYGEEFTDLPSIYKGRVRETSAKLFGSGALQVSGFAETKFSYDNYGRATGRVETFPFLPGNTTATDTWTFQFDHADRLRFEQRNAVGVNTAQTHIYDNFGREIYYVFGAGAPEAAAVAMTWNDRDQMTSKKLGYAGARQLDLIRYRYNERGWLTHINDVLRERWDTPYEICQGPAPSEDHTFVQMEEQTNLQGLLELLCNEENVVVRGTDPCEQGDCFDELADYQASLQSGLKKEKPVTDLSIHNLYRIAAQVIPLPQTPYRWTSNSSATTLLSRDDSQALASDLRNWMDANQYRYDSVTVRPKVIPGKDGNLELSIRVYGTNLPLDFLTFSFDNATPHSRAIFRKTNPRLAPCAVKPLPERETQLQSLAQNPAQLSYPTALYKVLVAGSATPLWRFEAELGGLNPNHRREVRIPVMNADERFSVRMTNGATAVWTLAQLLNERQQNGLSGVTAIERIIEKTTTNPCTLPPLECSAVQQDKQTQSLAEIQNAMCNMDPAQLSFPLTLYYVRLCDGSTAYILGQYLLQNLQGPYQVLGQMQVTGPDQLFNVAITRRRPLFAMQFAYEPNGNIGEMKWKVTAHDVKYYLNDYDPLNRLLGSSYGVEREVQSGTALPFVERIGTQEYDEFGISYDAIGNIEKLSRRGLIPSGNCFTPGLIDNLTYSYGEEGRLSGVTDAAPEPFRPHGFKPAAGGTAHYQYDHNGNLTSDAHKGIQFSYNFLNLPLSISTPQGNLNFLYDATGRKWAKSAYATAPADESGPEGIRFYAGNIEYLDGKVQHIAFADGRLVAEYNENGIFQNEYRAEYLPCRQAGFRTDHLGNTRLTFSDFNHDMVISPRISPLAPSLPSQDK